MRKFVAAKLWGVRRVVKTVCRLTGSEFVDGEAHYMMKFLRWFRAIFADAGHPLNNELKAQISVREVPGMFLSFKTRVNRYCKSFLLTAVRLYTDHLCV